MSRRRGAGDGSIYQRSSDERWVGAYKADGKRRYVYGDTQREAREKLRAAQREHEGKLFNSENKTLSTYLEKWIIHLKMAFKPGAHDTYRRYVRRYILPTLGHLRMKEINTEMVQEWVSGLCKQGLAAATVKMTYAILSSAYVDAIATRKMEYNPCQHVKLPRVAPQNMTVLSPAQAKALLYAAEGSPIETLLNLALATGMRRGELMALRWEDIDENGILQVRRTGCFLSLDEGYRFVENEPKSRSSARSITLPLFALDSLKSHQSHQAEKRSIDPRWNEKNLVFPSRKGKHYDPRTLREQFRRVLRKAGLPLMRFHDLRHTVASTLLQKGINPKVVQELLGHSSVVITLTIYAHVLPSMHSAAMQELDNLFRGDEKSDS